MKIYEELKKASYVCKHNETHQCPYIHTQSYYVRSLYLNLYIWYKYSAIMLASKELSTFNMPNKTNHLISDCPVES